MSIINIIKISGAALVIACGALSAYLLNSKVKSTLARAEGMISLLRYIKTQVSCYAMPIDRILSGCDRELLSECGYTQSAMPKSLDGLISGCSALDARTLKIMSEFSGSFGKSYRSEQVKLCESSIEDLTALRVDMSERLPIRKKLNSTLCISGAMAIVILLV